MSKESATARSSEHSHSVPFPFARRSHLGPCCWESRQSRCLFRLKVEATLLSSFRLKAEATLLSSFRVKAEATLPSSFHLKAEATAVQRLEMTMLPENVVTLMTALPSP
jgi:hypothetical protein